MRLLNFSETVTVLVVGDVMLDEYVWGDVERISPEAPVPIVEFRENTYALGGAGNAAANLASLKADAVLVGVVGRDHEAGVLRSLITEFGIDHRLVDSERPTTTKTRVIGGSQQVLRIDREDREDVPAEIESSLFDLVAERLVAADCLLLSDYGKGCLTGDLSRRLIEAAYEQEKPVVVDPQGRDYARYARATVLTPNVMEAQLAIESLGPGAGVLEDDMVRLQSVLEGAAVLLTRGSQGVTLFRAGSKPHHISARRRHVFDVTGAGDTVAAALSLGLAKGAGLEDASLLANAAGGIAVGKVGTATVEIFELEDELPLDHRP